MWGGRKAPYHLSLFRWSSYIWISLIYSLSGNICSKNFLSEITFENLWTGPGNLNLAYQKNYLESFVLKEYFIKCHTIAIIGCHLYIGLSHSIRVKAPLEHCLFIWLITYWGPTMLKDNNSSQCWRFRSEWGSSYFLFLY